METGRVITVGGLDKKILAIQTKIQVGSPVMEVVLRCPIEKVKLVAFSQNKTKTRNFKRYLHYGSFPRK